MFSRWSIQTDQIAPTHIILPLVQSVRARWPEWSFCHGPPPVVEKPRSLLINLSAPPLFSLKRESEREREIGREHVIQSRELVKEKTRNGEPGR